MKKAVLFLFGVTLFVSCEKETVIVLEDQTCEECQGATVNISPQARGNVNRGELYAWIKDITVVAKDDQQQNYGKTFTLVDSGGSDEFLLEDIPTGEYIDFSASSTSITQTYNGQTLVEADPNDLTNFEARMPYAEYATDAPVSQYIENGDNLVYLQMNTSHGRIISSFQLANNIQSGYNLVVTRGGDVATVTGANGVVSYWNGTTSLSGEDQTFDLQVKDIVTGQVVFTRAITETIVASTSTTNKYVVGLGFVEDSTVEVIFTWQPWVEGEGEDETDDGLSPNGLDCGSCGTVTNQDESNHFLVQGNVVIEDKNLLVAGDLNFNGVGSTLTITCGSLTVSGNINGASGAVLTVAGDVVVTGNTQNELTINANECF